MHTQEKPLGGKIAVVTGATRGAGRGIACMLGEAGATVYCTGRSSRGQLQSALRPETIEETADMVTAYGGKGIAVRVDHMQADQVESFFHRVKNEQGRLDILVNDIWGGDSAIEWGKPFWELSPTQGLPMLANALNTHILTSRYAAPLLMETGNSLLVEITDGNTLGYRGNLYYDLVKHSVIRLAFAQAFELRRRRVTVLALTPGFLRSEAMLELFGISEVNWKVGAEKDPHFIASETPCFVGRAVAALASPCAATQCWTIAGGMGCITGAGVARKLIGLPFSTFSVLTVSVGCSFEKSIVFLNSSIKFPT